MPKVVTSLPLPLGERRPGVTKGQWLYQELRQAVVDRRLEPCTRLPSSREMARRHGISRGTVLEAFERLVCEGFLESRVGDGTYVLPIHSSSKAGGGEKTGMAIPTLSSFGRKVRSFPGHTTASHRAFRANQPDLSSFPVEVWTRLSNRSLRRDSRRNLGASSVAGAPELREAIARYLGVMRGVRCEPSQVLVLSGVQEAIDLTGRMLLDPGDRVCLEDPGYIGASQVFEALGAEVIPVPVDARGLVVDTARNIGAGARLVYVTPAHQFPLGMAMDAERRLALLDWARSTGALILEDDYDSELRFGGPSLAALQGLDDHGMVLFAGTFNKVLFPALRLAFLVLPKSLVEPFVAARSLSTRFPPGPEQITLAAFLNEGHFARHLGRMRKLYARRLEVLRHEVDARLGDRLTLEPCDAGMQALGRLAPPFEAELVARRAAEQEVEVLPVATFALERALGEGLILGFGAVAEEEIVRGVAVLDRILR